MKKITLLFILHFSFLTFHSSAQSCLPEGITFTTQDQIDNFQTNYSGCFEIEGNVVINGGVNITNLYGLNVLKSIGGSLDIHGNDSLINLSGLEALGSISGDLIIGGFPSINRSFTSLTGLENLVFVGGDIEINWNFALKSIAGLASMTSIEGSLAMDRNPALVSLSGLDNVTSIEGNLTIFNSSSALVSLKGLDNLTSIGGSLSISKHWLISLSGLESLISIAGGLYISGGYAMTSLTGLNNVASVGGNVMIGVGRYGANPVLSSLTGLEDLTSIGGSLYIWQNHSLIDLSGLNQVTSLGGDFVIALNELLANLTGLDNLTTIGGDIGIFNNDALTNLTGLENLDVSSIGNLAIYNNNSLSTCDVQFLCDYLSNPNGSITIYSNAAGCNNPYEIADNCGITLPCLPNGNYYFFNQADIDDFQTHYPGCNELKGLVKISGEDITNLDGLSVATSIVTLIIESNKSLPNLTGLENLSCINGHLIIEYNKNLHNLEGLFNLDSIMYGFDIQGNIGLSSLYGLDGQTFIGGNLHIGNNPSLSVCKAEAICAYLANPNGGVSIYNNAPGCSSQEEVEETCGIVGTNEFNIQDSRFKVDIFPNPSHGKFEIKYHIQVDSRQSVVGSHLRLSIYDIHGKELKTLVNKKQSHGEYKIRFDGSDLPAGIYLVRLQAGSLVETAKLVVMR